MPEILKMILSAGGVLGIIGLLFGVLIAASSKLFSANEEGKNKSLADRPSCTDCNGCSSADCSASDVMGDSVDKMIAHVRCGGTFELAQSKYQYQGIADCTAAVGLLDGYLRCRFGCLGLGSCVAACKNCAIRIENGVAVVDHKLCSGCGSCIDACPKGIIDLIPVTAKYTVSCLSVDGGEKTKDVCLTGCDGCKICEVNCPSTAIHIVDNLARIDYKRCTSCGICAEHCPANIIRSVL